LSDSVQLYRNIVGTSAPSLSDDVLAVVLEHLLRRSATNEPKDRGGVHNSRVREEHIALLAVADEEAKRAADIIS